MAWCQTHTFAHVNTADINLIGKNTPSQEQEGSVGWRWKAIAANQSTTFWCSQSEVSVKSNRFISIIIPTHNPQLQTNWTVNKRICCFVLPRIHENNYHNKNPQWITLVFFFQSSTSILDTPPITKENSSAVNSDSSSRGITLKTGRRTRLSNLDLSFWVFSCVLKWLNLKKENNNNNKKQWYREYPRARATVGLFENVYKVNKQESRRILRAQRSLSAVVSARNFFTRRRWCCGS